MEVNSRENIFQNFPRGDYNNPETETYPSSSEVTERDEKSLNVSESQDLNEEEAVQYQEETVLIDGNPVFRKMIRWLVYVTAFLMPLWFLPWTADVLEFNKQILLIAAAGIGLVLCLIDVIKSGVARFKPSSFYFPIFGLVVASAISIIFSVNRTTSLFGAGESRSAALITLISLAVLFFLVINVIEDRGRALKKILSVSLVLTFIFGILQTLGIYLLKDVSFASRSFNSVGSLNALGILAAMALVFFISSNRHKEGEIGMRWYGWIVKGLRYFGLALAFFIVMLVNWWPVWTVVFVSLLVLVAFALAGNVRLVKDGKMRLFVIPLAVIILGTFLMLINFNLASLKSELPIEIAPSHKTSWKIVLDSLKIKPLGQGAENFIIAYDKFKPASIANTVFYQIRFTDAVSEAANMAVEGGVLVALSFLALLCFYGKEMIVRLKNGFNGNGEAGAIWAASTGLLVAFFLYPFNLVTITLLFFLLALLVLSVDDPDRGRVINLESDVRHSLIGSLVFIVGLVAVLVASYFTFNNYTANIFLAKALKNSDRNKAIEYFVKSANSNPNDARTHRSFSQTIIAQLADDLKRGLQKSESRETYNGKIQNQIISAVNIAIRASDVSPADSQNWNNRGLVYENLLTLISGADQEAINSYNESLARNPADPNMYLRIGNVHLSLADNLKRILNAEQSNVDFATIRKQMDDNLIKAGENYKKAIFLYNNFGQALYNLAMVYDRQNKLPDAIKQFEKLRAANTKDPSIVFQLGLLYYYNNRKNDAFTAWQQAVVLFPNYSNARWYLSLVYEERGDLGNALKQVQEIEKLNPNNELVKQRLVQLQSGKRTIPPERVLDKKPLDR